MEHFSWKLMKMLHPIVWPYMIWFIFNLIEKTFSYVPENGFSKCYEAWKTLPTRHRTSQVSCCISLNYIVLQHTRHHFLRPPHTALFKILKWHHDSLTLKNTQDKYVMNIIHSRYYLAFSTSPLPYQTLAKLTNAAAL